jgi:hypothetical protein
MREINKVMTREMLEIVEALETGSINGEPLTNETEMILQTELQKLKKLYKLNTNSNG